MLQTETYSFKSGSTQMYYAAGFNYIKDITPVKNVILLTDENVFKAHTNKFSKYRTIVIKAGEVHKNQTTVNGIVQELIALGADRSTFLVGVGGGVVTDITGYVAATYMRGIEFGFVPTTVLALVDASIGGKNGIDVGEYKNLIGTIRQPKFILHDMALLNTLPLAEWQNGFAEVIKHACIKDASLFTALQRHSVGYYQKNKKELCKLIQRNAQIKLQVVKKDEFEKGERRLLNFGHTLGHAIENVYQLSHGNAIAVGMTYAAKISQELLAFKNTNDVVSLLQQYGLPVQVDFNTQKVFEVMKMDKKKQQQQIQYILLKKIGKGVINPIDFKQLEQLIQTV